jgi:hypothetical protein
MSMPFGGFINIFPPVFFMVVHLLAFVIGAYFAKRTFEANLSAIGWGFTLYAIAEVVYMTYHLDWTVFLFAHTIAEVLDLVAFVLIFSAIAQHLLAREKRPVQRISD